MAGDAAINGLINDFRKLQFEAKKTVSQLNETKSAISGGLGSAAGTGGLSASGYSPNVATSSGFDREHAAARRDNTNLDRAATRAIRKEAKFARGSMMLVNDVLSGDPESIVHGVAHMARHFRKVSKIAGQAGAAFVGLHQGEEAFETYSKGNYIGVGMDFAKSVAGGAMMGGPTGAAVAFMVSSLTFAFESLKPNTLREWLRSPFSSLGGAQRDAESHKKEEIRATINAFRNVYGGGEIRATTIQKILDTQTEPDKLKADVEKISTNLDKGYAQIGLGNFDKGVGLIRQAEEIDKKYGFMGGKIMMDPASVYAMLESQRIATRNFASAMSSRSPSRTGD